MSQNQSSYGNKNEGHRDESSSAEKMRSGSAKEHGEGGTHESGKTGGSSQQGYKQQDRKSSSDKR